METQEQFKKEIDVKWIRAKSGTTYLCPVDALERLGTTDEEKLKLICVDESQNPHNE